ncbi:MAG: hypothetical protein A2542_03560 [Parcubacteria group bacterium RIFOXYD2_FULL_52_8]|nr:MAG: hypothetical protein A2542_03560 [Parcubacteria group bacterium RIFOXYD2_FULL_52_8]
MGDGDEKKYSLESMKAWDKQLSDELFENQRAFEQKMAQLSPEQARQIVLGRSRADVEAFTQLTQAFLDLDRALLARFIDVLGVDAAARLMETGDVGSTYAERLAWALGGETIASTLPLPSWYYYLQQLS